MQPLKVGINGFGRIGRAFLRIAFSRPDIEVSAINDLSDVHSLAYLLQYDTVYKVAPFDVHVEIESDGKEYLNLVAGDTQKKILILHSKVPKELPWADLKIDVAVESTGLFTSFDSAKDHIEAGAKHVVITAPAKGESETLGETVLLSVNEDKFGTTNITSNASCTTNAASPLIAILDESLGIEKAILNTVHAYTASQSLVDGGGKRDLREGRAGAQNIVPSSTGAAIAVTKAFAKLKGLFDGISMRVPVACGSIVDVTFISKKQTTVDEVNNILKSAAENERWKNVFIATEEELVSSDIIGLPYASIADLKMTRVVGGNLVKVLAWYDNEIGYTHTLVEHVARAGRKII